MELVYPSFINWLIAIYCQLSTDNHPTYSTSLSADKLFDIQSYFLIGIISHYISQLLKSFTCLAT